LSDSNKIYCERGYYDTYNEITQFSKNASLLNEEQILKADSIIYFKKSGIGYATGHVYWHDTLKHNIIYSQRAEYKEKYTSILATGNPVFIDASDKDTMFLKADTLFSAESDTIKKRWFNAYHHVIVYKNNVSAKCDSIYYSDIDSTFRFYGNPVLWVDENQLTADTISMTMANKKINSFLMIKNSLIVNIVDSTRFNQIQGKKMTGHFKEGELYKLLVEGNGESIYYGEDDSKKLIGVNKAVCSNMIISIKDNKVQRIKFLEKPTATLYPPNDAPEAELKLKLFKWLLKDRPQRSNF
jgi:lipopolysaccharide export system protein LptA